MSSRREEVAGDCCAAAQLNKRAAALLKTLGFSIKSAVKNRECLRLRRHSLSVLLLRWILIRLQRSSCRAANVESLAVTRHFCSAKVLVRGLRRCEASLAAPPQGPAKRNFQRKFALRRFKSQKLAARHVDCAKTLQAGTASNRKRECSDIPGHARPVQHRKPRTPRNSKGPRPFC